MSLEYVHQGDIVAGGRKMGCHDAPYGARADDSEPELFLRFGHPNLP
jgi:hypothetical protein